MRIKGNKVELKPAQESDRKKIYTWLSQSDLTPSIMGPPEYPDLPIPTWEEFCKEYPPSFFHRSGDGKGRNYIIMINNEEVGTIGYDLLDKEKDRVVLDIWMRSEEFCGRGYGSDSLNALSTHIHENYGIKNFLICPSSRNKRAIKAYKKAGFKYVKTLDKKEQENVFGLSEYHDNILMIKRLIKKAGQK